MTDVETADGIVRGRVGKRARQWRGIPYAAAPVGELRLRAPQPVRPWTGVRDATRFGSAAAQRRNPMVGLRPTGEDCLTLNVTAPLEPSSRPRPVLVYIHGGSYVFDTGARYTGESLAARGDVVVVSINYRLGALGYFDFSEFGFDANLGLRDQVAALRWVRRNIAAFGGDPDNVTVFGESSGGDAVLTLMVTPSAEGLFHRAIAQSTAADWAAIGDVEAQRFARRFIGCLGVGRETARQALATAPVKALLDAGHQALQGALHANPGTYAVSPVVDGEFLPVNPLDALAAGDGHRVPLIIGSNRDECTLFQFDLTVPTSPSVLRAALGRCGADYERVVAAYPGYPQRAVALQVSTDFVLWRPMLEVLQGHSGVAPTFCYRFDFAPQLLRATGLGAIHGIELLAVFGGVSSWPVRLLTLPGGRRGFLAVQDEVQDHWLAFARDGRPSAPWPQYTVELRSTLVFDDPSRLEADPERGRRLAWEGIRIPASG
ncbi:carboxylesterase/lipase family protein [Nocardioides sp. zg-1228]|uniref:carboxylesterase/lipase family protein n=1 Tax=Nocardioides sp. zg-1228 TaxID=2763008 RepID=UPI00164239F5|nr:carboxylesterase/lipase family protein [Nocardioides sp. zg-1228]MBC2934399.1 carboxylesterase/lipase family protein [Nocardioides sp. zg-1228]QSF59168.1 carboxylesterase/lipase family protein [Nocardioides sp. zg-1228]